MANTTSTDAASAEGEAPELARCYHCDEELAPGEIDCPRCQRRQVRVCYCGNRIPRTQAQCQFCGADWEASARGHSRRSRKRRSASALLRSGAVGCLIAVLAAVFTNHVISKLGIGGAGAGGEAGSSFGSRLAQVGQALEGAWVLVCGKINRHIGGIGMLALVAAVGVAAGILFQLHTERAHASRRVRRKRRRRATDL